MESQNNATDMSTESTGAMPCSESDIMAADPVTNYTTEVSHVTASGTIVHVQVNGEKAVTGDDNEDMDVNGDVESIVNARQGHQTGSRRCLFPLRRFCASRCSFSKVCFCCVVVVPGVLALITMGWILLAVGM